jgi:hypothetical protein
VKVKQEIKKGSKEYYEMFFKPSEIPPLPKLDDEILMH